ncbi:aminotransferase class V-fold PLP-dependent enzyme [Candidatus Saccharibacteria bacterium]|nr:aminotransferase class V-fold PLP-dependent enzyme [Candidatus Saccharibacteria bacterium]
MNDFPYLKKDDVYLDAACQSLRPQPVIDALNSYYTGHNSCGERVKYKWGRITDEKVEATREKVLKFLKLKSKDYFVSFTLNTTYGINLILDQIRLSFVKKVMTSDIEHNSPFLSTIAFARKHTAGNVHMGREVIVRNPDGSIPIEKYDFTRALVVVNCASNVDGRQLTNLSALEKAIHKAGGILVIDAAQAMAHSSEILHKTDADAICFSAHKMYAPSLGVMVVKKSMLEKIDTTFIGGGMVDDVDLDTYQLSANSPQHIYTKFESGLQAWGEIVAFGAAIDWLEHLPKSAHQNLMKYSQQLFDFLSQSPKVHLVNTTPNPTMSFYIEGVDSHLLGAALADEGIMARTGYFCVHYYLDHIMHYPPLIRFALGYHTRPSDIEKTIAVLKKLLA